MLFPRRLRLPRMHTPRTGGHRNPARRRHCRELGISARSVCCGPAVEELEGRQMLAATATTTVARVAVPTLINLGRVAAPDTVKPAGSPSTAAPYTPQQVETAYGDNSIVFNGIVGNGAGQTIAIVDAYNDPNIVSDTAAFNTRFGLPQFNAGGPTLQVLNQTGGTTLPTNTNTTLGDWDLEESLDVQWAHSMAPQANIILFESNTANDPDMDQAEVTAAGWQGVSVVSNSWAEGEFSQETSEDQYFQTPTGHQGVTFLASAGDSGTPAGYPAYSPYVVAVGGTNLQIQSGGGYISESAWSSGGGGISTVEGIPSYQAGLNGFNGASKTFRNVPDISADADPNSGVYVYDTWNEGQGGGYFQVGGTSLSSPLWSGFIAIANQGRALAGESTLNGYTQTLPMLYSLPSSDFHDVTSGSNGTYSAAPGYDLATGRGTPIANLLVPAFAGYGTTPPSISGPTSGALIENSTLTFSTSNSNAITVTDAFSAGNPDSLRISVLHGTLTLGTTNGVSFVSGANGSSAFTVSGTVAKLDTALNGLIYQPTSNYTGSDTISVSATDSGLTGSHTVTLSITGIAPHISVPSAASVTENSTLTLNGSSAISVADSGGTAEQLTVGVSHGTLSLGTKSGLTVTGNGTGTMILTGSLSKLNSDLPSLTYTPTFDYAGSDLVSLSDKDTSDNLTATASFSITVNPLPPTITAPSRGSLNQNGNLAFTSGEAISVADPGGTAEQMLLTVSHGTLDLGTTAGLTVAGNGAGTVTLTGSLPSLNSDLTTLVYSPTSGYHGSDTLSLWDEDTADSLLATATVSITINPLVPTISAPSAVSLNDASSLSFTAGNSIKVSDLSGTAEKMSLTVGHGTLALASFSGLTVVGDATATLTLIGTLSNLNNGLASLSYSPASQYSGPDTLSLSDNDTTDNLAGAATVAITVNSVAPTITAPSAVSLNEDSSIRFTAGDAISVADSSGTAEQMTLTVSHGALGLGTITGLTVSGNGTATVTLAGSPSNLTTDLPNLTYTPTVGYYGSDTLNLSDTDTTNHLTGTASVSISVSPFLPTIAAPSTLSVNQNGNLAFNGGNSITVTDLNGTAEQLTLTVNQGTLSLGTTTGLTATGNGSTFVTLTGSTSNLNNDLTSLSYSPTAGYHGPDMLSLSDTDTANNLTGTASVAISVNSLGPTIAAPPTLSVNDNSSVNFTGGNAISVSDPSGASEQMTLTASHGTLNLGTTTGLTVTGDGTGSIILTGPLSNLNTDLVSLSYAPTANYSGPDTLALSVDDLFDSLTGTGGVSITVNQQSPTITAPSAASINENSSLAFTGVDAIVVADPLGTSEQMTLAVSHGTLNLGTTTGLTVTGNSTGTVTLIGSLSTLNGDLASLSYTPTAGYSGPDGLSLSADDTVDSLSSSLSVPLTVNAAAPTITSPGSASVNENGSVTFSATNGNQIAVSDINGAVDSLALSVADGTLTLATGSGLTFTSGANGSASFTVSGTLSNLNAALNGMTYQPNTSYAGSDSLAVSLTDMVLSQTASASVAITVNAFSPPSIAAPPSATVSENASLVFSPGNSNTISITDSGAGTNADTATLSVSNGTLTLGSTIGVIFTSGSNDSATFTVKGTVSNLNAALSGLNYQPTNGYAGSDSLAISVMDPTDNKSGSTSIAITVNPFALSMTAPATASLNENGSFVFSGANAISVNDANPGAVDSLALSVTQGTVTLSTTSGLTLTGTNGTASFTVAGTVSNLNAALSGLTYTPTAGYTGSDLLSVSITDPGDTESASKSVALTINAFSPPTISAPGSASVVLNGSLVFSSANHNAITVADSGPGSGSDSLMLTATHGIVTLSTTSGLTITGGANGSATITVTGSVASLNAALSGLTYKPTSGYTGSDSLAISIKDSVDNLSAAANAALTVNNSPPAITAPASASVLVTATLVFSTANNNAISVADVNAGGSVEPLTLTSTDGTLTLGSTTGITFTSGANKSASMTINGTLANLSAALSGLSFTPAAVGNATVVLSYTDVGNGLMASATINITVIKTGFKLVQGLPVSPPSSPAVTRASSVSAPTGGGTITPAATLTTANDTTEEGSLPPDALTQWQGLAAAVEMLIG